jgi:hypothetical protein
MMNAAPTAYATSRLNANTNRLSACRLSMPSTPLKISESVISESPTRSSTARISCSTVQSLRW